MGKTEIIRQATPIGADNSSPTEVGPQSIARTNPSAGSILQSYLTDVWIGRNANAVAIYFDEEVRFLAEEVAKHKIEVEALAKTDPPIHIRSITSGATTATAYCTASWANGEDYDMFLLIEINSKGRISYYRWMSDLPPVQTLQASE